MNKKTEQRINDLETAGKNLLQQAKNLRNGFKPSNKCKYGEYTSKFFGKECKSCGSPKTVICKIKANGRRSHSSKECSGNSCKFKEL